MSAHLAAAASAFDAAIAQRVGCKGLFTAPLTERKLAMLHQRLGAGGDYLATALRLVDAADPEAPYIPPIPVEARTQSGENAGADVLELRRLRLSSGRVVTFRGRVR